MRGARLCDDDHDVVMTKIMVMVGGSLTEPMTVCFLFVPGADGSIFYVRRLLEREERSGSTGKEVEDIEPSLTGASETDGALAKLQ